MSSTRETREGDIVVLDDRDALDMTDVRDIKLLNNALRRGWPIAQERAENYMKKLDMVMEGASDEKVIIAAAAVAQRMLKTYFDTVRLASGNAPNNSTQVNIQNNTVFFPELSTAERKRLIESIRNEQE